MAEFPWIFSFQALGGGNEIQIFESNKAKAEQVAELAIHEVKLFEQKYSRYRKESIVSQINSNAGIEETLVDAETAALLNYADTCFRLSEGCFDITSGILRKAWDFKNAVLPSEDHIKSLLPLIGWDKVEWDDRSIFLPKEGMEIDLGGLGKEFAVDKIAGLLTSSGIRHALINLGGDVKAIGTRPNRSPWKIGVKDPRIESKILRSVDLADMALATSGDYERFFEIDGRRYSHFLDVKTGYPVDTYKSVTVIAESCLVAGSLSTIAMLLGPEKGKDFLENSSCQYFCVT